MSQAKSLFSCRLVHTAPGHGVEDFDVCRSHADLNLPVLCPVDDAGCFTSEAGGDLVGLSVLKEGNLAALQVRDLVTWKLAYIRVHCKSCLEIGQCRLCPAHGILFSSLSVRLEDKTACPDSRHETVVCKR